MTIGDVVDQLEQLPAWWLAIALIGLIIDSEIALIIIGVAVLILVT